MIQRFQSVLMAFALLLHGVVIWFFPMYTRPDHTFFASDSPVVVAVCLFSVGLSLYALIKFRLRRVQFMTNRFNMLMNLALFIWIAFRMFKGVEASEVRSGMGLIIPLAVVVLLAMANRYIMKDERAVRAADRIR